MVNKPGFKTVELREAMWLVLQNVRKANAGCESLNDALILIVNQLTDKQLKALQLPKRDA